MHEVVLEKRFNKTEIAYKKIGDIISIISVILVVFTLGVYADSQYTQMRAEEYFEVSLEEVQDGIVLHVINTSNESFATFSIGVHGYDEENGQQTTWIKNISFSPAFEPGDEYILNASDLMTEAAMKYDLKIVEYDKVQ